MVENFQVSDKKASCITSFRNIKEKLKLFFINYECNIYLIVNSAILFTVIDTHIS